MIVAVAVMIDGEVVTFPAPARHYNILHKFPLPEHEHGDQGFIDDKRGFVGRVEAAGIALRENGVTKLMSPPWLFSEDLW